MTPLVVIEGSDGAYGQALRRPSLGGWTDLPELERPPQAPSAAAASTSAEDAAAALLAAVGGAGVLIHARAERDVIDRLCDDLRRLGHSTIGVGVSSASFRLTREEQALVEILLDGESLGAAARRMNIARRTADRRLASVRAKLGVETTAEALVALGTARRVVQSRETPPGTRSVS